MKNMPIITGIIAFVSPISLLIFSILWIDIIGLLPLFISPILGVLGVVHGIAKIKEDYAVLGIVLSAIGLLENLFLIFGMCYLGSRF